MNKIREELKKHTLYTYNYAHPNGKTYVQKIKYKSTGNPVGRPKFTEEEKKRAAEYKKRQLEEAIKNSVELKLDS